MDGCPATDEIAAYLAGELGGEALAALKAHLTTCSGCSQMVALLGADTAAAAAPPPAAGMPPMTTGAAAETPHADSSSLVSCASSRTESLPRKSFTSEIERAMSYSPEMILTVGALRLTKVA